MDFSIRMIKFNKSVCETKITKISKFERDTFITCLNFKM